MDTWNPFQSVRTLAWTPLLLVLLMQGVCGITLEANAAIPNIAKFLEQCPTNDPLYSQFRSDFRILRNGIPVGAIACTEPISAMPSAQISDELIVIQALRTSYYMDHGRPAYLPWTSLPFYDWMKGKISGFNINDSATNNSCCNLFDGGFYVTLIKKDDQLKVFYLNWVGISSGLALWGHEVRHRDGFPHDSACGVTGGCDLTYDEANLSPYGIQYWLFAHWLSGDINVGAACQNATPASATNRCDLFSTSAAATGQCLADQGNLERTRFSQTLPPTLTLPGQPLGTCPALTITDCVFNWAEIAYAGLVAPLGSATRSAATYAYRYYPQTASYLGASSLDNHVYYIGPLSGNSLVDVGALSKWRTAAACN